MTLYDQLAALPVKELNALLGSLGYTKKRTSPVTKSSVSTSLYPVGYPSQGPTSFELEAWLERKHDPAFRVAVKLPTLGKPPRLSPGKYQDLEAAWNEQARRLWKDRGVDA